MSTKPTPKNLTNIMSIRQLRPTTPRGTLVQSELLTILIFFFGVMGSHFIPAKPGRFF